MIRAYLIRVLFLGMLGSFPSYLYSQSSDVLLWENDIRSFEHLDSTEIYPDSAILFTGSSSIRLWSTLVQDMQPYPIIQRGFGGAKLNDMAVYAERIVYPHTVRAIVLFIANDIAGNADDKTPEEADSLFREVIHTIRKKNAEAPVFWIAITPTALRWNVWPEIIKANNLIESSCWNYINTYFIRTDTAFLKSDGQPDEELFLPDGLHLNEKGYAVWTMIIKGALKKVVDE